MSGSAAQLLMSEKLSYGEVMTANDLPREPASFQCEVWGSSDFQALFAYCIFHPAAQGGTGICGRKCHFPGMLRDGSHCFGMRLVTLVVCPRSGESCRGSYRDKRRVHLSHR